MAKVTLQNVAKSYPGERGGRNVQAVRDFNLAVQDREFVVLVGPSGCGKSTTLRMIAGLEDVSAGEISIGGRVVNHLPPKDRDVALVFQNSALYPHLSVYENLAFGLRMRQTPPAETARRVQETAALLGLEDYLARKPKALSGGQRQRVALGRALVRRPQVFLLDEPLSNLDARLRLQMRTEIRQLQQRLQATMIYVTHDQVEAMTMADRIVVMAAVADGEMGHKAGVIQQIDAPLKVYHEPVNLFVAGFLGSPPMNFITGTLLAREGGLFFEEKENGPIQVRLAHRPGAAAFAGREVILGLRAEDLELLAGAGQPSENTFPAIVDLVEPLGAETQLHLQSGRHTVICRTQGPVDHHEVGQRREIKINSARAHLFDPVSTSRIVG